VDIRGIDAVTNNQLRNDLAGKQIRITVLKNTLAIAALKDTELGPLTDLIDGPTAMVYGGESVVNVAREMVEKAKQIEALELKGAVLDGTVFGADDVERLSKYPTREEAVAEVVTLILSPGRNLAGSIKGPASKLASIIKAIQEKLEDGEEIKKAG
jgi:large subunit ribosomal protein L10